MPKEIPIFHCCGVFGWYIPWGSWCSQRDTLIHATQSIERPYVYIYSLRGQLGNPHREEMVNPHGKNQPNCMGTVNVDSFVSTDMEMDWEVLRRAINGVALKWERAKAAESK